MENQEQRAEPGNAAVEIPGKLETARLILRPWKKNKADAKALYSLAKDERVGPAAGWGVHRDPAHSLQIIRDILCTPDIYAVLSKEDAAENDRSRSAGLVGAAGLTYGSTGRRWLKEREAELGYWIGVPFWGKGYATEAAMALLHRAFYDLGMETVWCGYYDGNEQSRRVQEKCGFVYDHTDTHAFCEALNEERVEHFMKLTRERFLDM